MADPEEFGEELYGPHLELVALIDKIDVDCAFGALAAVYESLEEWFMQFYLLLIALEEAYLDHLVRHWKDLQSHLLVLFQQRLYL